MQNIQFPGEIINATAVEIILQTYDFFLQSCERRDLTGMNRSLLLLMEALNFEFGEESRRLYRLYEYCQKCIFKKRYDEAHYIIRELRRAWAAGFGLN
jgi:hypothetical protein